MPDPDRLDEFESWAANRDDLSPYALELVKWMSDEVRGLRLSGQTVLALTEQAEREAEPGVPVEKLLRALTFPVSHHPDRSTEED